MIRLATAHDFSAIFDLWESCFPGENAFDRYFFSQIYRPEYTLLLMHHDKLCAMTQMIPYPIRINGVDGTATYIYGACTAQDERKKGYMARLLLQSFALDQTQNRVASVLIPQGESLFAFYARFGYQTTFYVENQCYETSLLQKDASAVLRSCTCADIPQLAALFDTQTAACATVVLRSTEQWNRQITQFNLLGGGVYGLFIGNALVAYAFFWNGSQPWIQELLSNSKSTRDALCQKLCELLCCTSLKVTSCGTQTALGMIKYYRQEPPMQGYMNLMFN